MGSFMGKTKIYYEFKRKNLNCYSCPAYRAYGLDMHLKVPVIDQKGYLYKIYKRTPKHIPRIGELIYILPNFDLKVESVTYSGHALNVISIQLEPIPARYVEELVKDRSKLALKAHSGWNYSEGLSHNVLIDFSK
jgi:hypothetical protein